jgi:beta-glucosidase
MNGYSANSKVVSITPWWQTAMKAIIAVFAVLDILCIAMLIRSKTKKKENIQVEVQS